MAKICEVCGKTSMMAVVRKLLRGHYNPTTKKRKYPNLQHKKIGNKRIWICAKCLKAMGKIKA
ncbi:MAG: 50S ribosomal protein L28 [Candidatus Portnoybacteria bacterium CG23_combo_of_CG06-09_8_20_14_all_37_13]|uniref:50S ribosomal protein L28 n=1 Tax=Candidatus Portnoybacteria bacterium CG23_combo_of_CG06-09_8_20_14_all_37_13 TaxID=1974819 RepID=A0A2G9YCX8_9BACT|nr:MAG: 50S ribosomal protein L28 [Candidatus Portnoybacteria bacterium CG23_combo_of_CG06-09_8_20_14_all_37_13]